MLREVIFARVIKGGSVKPGDIIKHITAAIIEHVN